MRFINLIFQILLSLTILILLLYWFTGIRSAFEADQLCHSELFGYSIESEAFACDHDTETHQWILFEKQKDSKPAKVIRIFRYKFL